MGSQWTSKYAILRDLSFAQGRKVPAAIVGSVGVGQKPPVITVKEDTEEEFFENCVGVGDVSTEPDLTLIKKMLNVVRESDPMDNEDTDKIVEISKLNPLSEQFIPKGEGVGDEKKETTMGTNVHSSIDITVKTNPVIQKEVKQPKKHRERNAALISLLEKEQSSLARISPTDATIPTIVQTFETESEASTNTNTQNLEIKLLKPNDFIIDSNVTQSVEKVNEWLQKPTEAQPEKMKSISLSPKNMFRKKIPAPLSLENTHMFKKKSDTSSIRSSESDNLPKQSDNVFVPSSCANEYYKRFVERRQIQEATQEDIWRRAERLMKEIDTKRIMEKEKKVAELLESTGELNNVLEEDIKSTNNRQRPTLPLNIPGLEIPSVRLSIVLPQHRHDLPEECKVCLALAKFKQQQGS